MSVLNIALMFSEEAEASIAACSQQFAPQISSDYIIGVNSRAHVTVLFVDMDPGRIISALEKTSPQIVPITTKGVYCESGSGGLYWYGLRVGMTEELAALRAQLLADLGHPPVGNGAGVEFFPHVTLGHGTLDNHRAVPDMSGLVKTYNVSLALGTPGPKYQFETQLWPPL